MRHFIILLAVFTMVLSLPVMAEAEKKACCSKDKAACEKKAACDKMDTCTKDCSKCPNKDKCDKKCPKKGDCPKDCEKACCKKKDACPKDCEKACCKKADGAAIVTVNGQKITAAEVNQELDKRMEAQKKRMPAGQEIPETHKNQMRRRIVDMKVDQLLIEQEMKKHDLNVTDEQVMEEIKNIAGQKGQSLEEVEKMIAGWGMTMDDLMGQVRYQMEVKALSEAMSKESTVSDEDVKKFYDDNPQFFTQKEQIKASHILCGKRGITEADYPAELEKITKAQERLKAGESFEDVAKDVSTCPSAQQGGDLGFFGRGQMDPAFEKAAFELEPGQTSDIVKSSFGYHIIKVTDKKAAGTTSLEEAQDNIKKHLEGQKAGEFWREYQEKMKENADIEYSKEEQALRDEMDKAAAAARNAAAPAPTAIQPKTASKKVEAEDAKK